MAMVHVSRTTSANVQLLITQELFANIQFALVTIPTLQHSWFAQTMVPVQVLIIAFAMLAILVAIALKQAAMALQVIQLDVSSAVVMVLALALTIALAIRVGLVQTAQKRFVLVIPVLTQLWCAPMVLVSAQHQIVATVLLVFQVYSALFPCVWEVSLHLLLAMVVETAQ